MKTANELKSRLAAKERKEQIINYLNKMDITHHAGTRLEDMTVRELEPVYIKEKGKAAKAYSE